MLRKKTSNTKTVSDKISELLARNANGEDDSSDEQNEDPRVEEEFDEYDLPDARSSDIRKRNVKLLSEQSARYRGKISSRNELDEEDEEDSSADEQSDEEQHEDVDESSSEDEDALGAFTKKLNGGVSTKAIAVSAEDDSEDDMDYSTNIENSSEESNEDGVEDEEEGDEEEDYENSDYEDGAESEDDASEEEHAEGTDIIAETNRQAEVQKGQCVQNQLQIWERLLEMRIHTQKILSKSNQLPAPNTLKAHQQDSEKLSNISRESVSSVSKLLSTLVQLQNAFDQQFTEQRNALKKTLKRALPQHDTEGNNAVPIKRFAEHIDEHFQEFKPYRNSVLLKWDDRTKLLTPGAGAKKKSLSEDYDIIRKIENTLQNRSTLIEKSQTSKDGDEATTDKELVENGNSENKQKSKRNVELYDDSDFYHQQLRELIEYKSNTSVSASEVTQQYMELQKLRQKMKKKVDTRASKGRKLRYTVHNKLINFMAPDDTSTWTEESKEELYRSLFAA
ncbi:PREDICTED: protein Aatf [Bactrocera latifrons]|uniref:protein Aatf n=1 Tax=Bactrocera latifrons TaxID=174628 RepID=UPI0008DD6AA6|nr:PREDICTED: protein Aatf [Bactrocera latifrons]